METKYINMAKEIFKGQTGFTKCIEFEDMIPMKLLKKIVQAKKHSEFIGIYLSFNLEAPEEFGVERLNDYNEIVEFYRKYPDMIYHTVLTDTEQSFAIAIELGSDKNYFCGDNDIIDLFPSDNDFSIYREM